MMSEAMQSCAAYFLALIIPTIFSITIIFILIERQNLPLFLQLCCLGNYHLINKNKKAVPMLKETLNLLQKTHSLQHYSRQKMIVDLNKKTDYEPFVPIKFLHSFLISCKKCEQQIIEEPTTLLYRENIYQKIREIPISKKTLKQNPVSIKSSFNFEFQRCPFDCTKDKYETKFSEYVQFFLYGKFPQNFNDSIRQEERKKWLISAKANKFFVIRQCQKGTNHLWKLNDHLKAKVDGKNQKKLAEDGHKRVPMIMEKKCIIKAIHDKFGHLPVHEIKEILKQAPFLDSCLEKQLEKGLDLCPKCIQQKKLHPLVKWTKPKKNNNNFEENNLQYLYQPGNENQQKISNKKITQNDLQNFRKDGIQWKIYQQNNVQKIWIFTNQVMKENYSIFGECLFFEELFGFPKQERFFLLTGINKSGKASLFAIAAMIEPTSESFHEIFDLFFKLMNTKHYPKTIFTTMDSNICNGLRSFMSSKPNKQLNKILQLYMSQTVLHYLSLPLKKKQEEILSIFQSTMQVKESLKFKENVAKIDSYLQQKRVLQFFVNISEHCCFCFFAPKFCGTPILYKLHDIQIKKFLKILTHFPSFYEMVKSIQSLKKYVEDISFQLSSLHKQLSGLQKLYSPETLQILNTKFQLAQQMTLKRKKCLFAQVENKQQKYLLEYNVRNCYWKCQCGNIYRDGFPCEHLILAIRRFGGDIRYYISERWLL